jgi:hypothetical protein
LLAYIADCDTAYIIKNLESHIGSMDADCYARKESNGDMVVLIVRTNNPVTIMYRRKNQNNTPDGLRVEKLVDLTL